jgi:hypothetical protein
MLSRRAIGGRGVRAHRMGRRSGPAPVLLLAAQERLRLRALARSRPVRGEARRLAPVDAPAMLLLFYARARLHPVGGPGGRRAFLRRQVLPPLVVVDQWMRPADHSSGALRREQLLRPAKLAGRWSIALLRRRARVAARGRGLPGA